MAFTGSCHCGKVSYTMDEDLPAGGMACNCSICGRKGTILHFSSHDLFTMHGDRDDITVYTFNTHNIRHQFCKTCGCAPFGEGTGPGGQEMVAINLRCADGVDVDALKVEHFDGASM